MHVSTKNPPLNRKHWKKTAHKTLGASLRFLGTAQRPQLRSPLQEGRRLSPSGPSPPPDTKLRETLLALSRYDTLFTPFSTLTPSFSTFTQTHTSLMFFPSLCTTLKNYFSHVCSDLGCRPNHHLLHVYPPPSPPHP